MVLCSIRFGRLTFITLMALVFSTAYSWAGEPEDATTKNNLTLSQSFLLRVRSGPIEGFTLDKVYINDMGHKLSGNIRFYSKYGDEIPRDKLRKGCRVKFVLNSDREVVLMQVE